MRCYRNSLISSLLRDMRLTNKNQKKFTLAYNNSGYCYMIY